MTLPWHRPRRTRRRVIRRDERAWFGLILLDAIGQLQLRRKILWALIVAHRRCDHAHLTNRHLHHLITCPRGEGSRVRRECAHHGVPGERLSILVLRLLRLLFHEQLVGLNGHLPVIAGALRILLNRFRPLYLTDASVRVQVELAVDFVHDDHAGVGQPIILLLHIGICIGDLGDVFV